MFSKVPKYKINNLFKLGRKNWASAVGLVSLNSDSQSLWQVFVPKAQYKTMAGRNYQKRKLREILMALLKEIPSSQLPSGEFGILAGRQFLTTSIPVCLRQLKLLLPRVSKKG